MEKNIQVVLDFDKTLTKRDSMTLFVLYLIMRKKITYLDFIRILYFQIFYKVGGIDNNIYKNRFLQTFKDLKHINSLLDEFSVSRMCLENLNSLGQLVKSLKSNDLLIISGTPQRLLEKLFPNHKVLGAKITSSKDSGKLIYQNCFGNQKVELLSKLGVTYQYAFSDSLKDLPLLLNSKKCGFIIKKDKVMRIKLESV